jgi:hypothetical protein
VHDHYIIWGFDSGRSGEIGSPYYTLLHGLYMIEQKAEQKKEKEEYLHHDCILKSDVFCSTSRQESRLWVS